MKLKEFVDQLSKIAETNPDLLVVTSTDDEGNGYRKLYDIGGLGHFVDSEFYPKKWLDEEPEYGDKKVNSICIN